MPLVNPAWPPSPDGQGSGIWHHTPRVYSPRNRKPSEAHPRNASGRNSQPSHLKGISAHRGKTFAHPCIDREHHDIHLGIILRHMPYNFRELRLGIMRLGRSRHLAPMPVIEISGMKHHPAVRKGYGISHPTSVDLNACTLLTPGICSSITSPGLIHATDTPF